METVERNFMSELMDLVEEIIKRELSGKCSSTGNCVLRFFIDLAQILKDVQHHETCKCKNCEKARFYEKICSKLRDEIAELS
jgi:hypothetical protein